MKDRIAFVIPMEPVPASRPRVTKKGIAYYPKPHNTYRAVVVPWLKSLDLPGDLPWEKPTLINIILRYHITKPRTSRLLTPRYDIDNLAKMTMDVMTESQRFWTDDVQVAVLDARKAFSPPGEEPFTYVCIGKGSTTE